MKRRELLASLLGVTFAAWRLHRHPPAAAWRPASAAAAEMTPYVEMIPGTDVKFEMLPIPAGTFKMGSPAGEPGRSEDEGPAHRVEIHAFWMGKNEVTWDEYDIFAFSNDIYKKQDLGVNLAAQPEGEKTADAMTRPTPPYTDETFGFGRKSQPVINISTHLPAGCTLLHFAFSVLTNLSEIHRLRW